jgi:hypothetical protein
MGHEAGVLLFVLRHDISDLNWTWTFSGQLIFGQFPRKKKGIAWDAYTAKETENRRPRGSWFPAL